MKKAGIFVSIGLVILAVIVLNVGNMSIKKKSNQQSSSNTSQVNVTTQNDVGTQADSQGAQNNQSTTQNNSQVVNNQVQTNDTTTEQQSNNSQSSTEVTEEEATQSSDSIEIDPNSIDYGELVSAQGMIFDKKVYLDKRSSQLYYKLYVTVPVDGNTVNLEYYCAKGVFDAVEVNDAINVEYTTAQGITVIVRLSK